METQAPQTQKEAPSSGEFRLLKGDLGKIDSWGLSPSEEIEVKLTCKATQKQAETFAKGNSL